MCGCVCACALVVGYVYELRGEGHCAHLIITMGGGSKVKLYAKGCLYSNVNRA